MLARFKIPIGWGELFKRTINEAWADDVLNLAAQQAYYFFFALFPALLALISIASFFPLANLTNDVVRTLGEVAPKDVVDVINEQLRKISEDRAGGLLTFAFLVTLWSSSGAVVSMCTTLNAAYDITESRPWWKVRLIAIALTIGLAFFVLLSVALIVAGPGVAQGFAERVGLGPAFVWTWSILRLPFIFLLIATAIAMVYYFAPDAEQEFVWITPGSVVASFLWIGVSFGMKTYFSTMGSYTETYGFVGAVMVLLLWFYLSGIALLIGAELNAEIEHASPHGKDVGERVPGEKKRIGAVAERFYEEQQKKGAVPDKPFPEGVNCDLDRKPPASQDRHIRLSELIIGTAALLPAAMKIGREVKEQISDGDRAA
ncbi:MAG TPA: YihY/virulence factor BrkB family protein [Vicinamibacterales bacterium]